MDTGIHLRAGQHRPMPHGGRWSLIACCVAAVAVCGCTARQYRRAADDEVYQLVSQKAGDPRWHLTDYSIRPSEASRFYDPTDPDHPPMPPDDPASHQLMRWVDGKRGSPCWDRDGAIPDVENPGWLSSLPCAADGQLVLDRQLAMWVALVNSREYQQQLEQLYLTALDVTYQRFRFDVQFFATNSTFYTNDGPKRSTGASRELRSETTTTAKKMTEIGSQVVVDFANTLVWQFAGPDQRQAQSLIDFSLVQPLLRGAGAQVVLESLTESERALLANVRQMERYRHGFYVNVVAGRGPSPGPLRGGLAVNDLSPTVPPATGGIYALLSNQVQIRNQRTNVAGLRDSLDQVQAHYDAGRIDFLQVNVAQQSLYNAQSTLLSLETAYEDRLDTYKLTLGLPPALALKIQDSLLQRFDLIDPRLTALKDRLSLLIKEMADLPVDAKPDYRPTIAALRTDTEALVAIIRDDIAKLDTALPDRRSDLAALGKREEVRRNEVHADILSVPKLDAIVARIKQAFPEVTARTEGTLQALRAYEQGAAVPDAVAPPPDVPAEPPAEPKPAIDAAAKPAPVKPSATGLQDIKNLIDDRPSLATKRNPVAALLSPQLTDLQSELLALMLIEATARVETVMLVPVNLDPCEALCVASQRRLDWMNARAAVVDTWRQIAVRANALRGNLNVILSGDVSTVNNNPFRFRGDTGRLRVGFQFDPPLTRLAERNLYREALIDYQQARRYYMAFEDRVDQNLRIELRSIKQTQLDFELRRAGVLVAIAQVDLAGERLQQPPKPAAAAAGQVGQTQMFGATTVRDLVQAYSGLLSAQNSFLAAWVDYEADRLNLDYDLGTMQLDTCGLWVDPGPIKPGYGQLCPLPDGAQPGAEELAPPPAVPLQQALDIPAPPPPAPGK